MEKILIVDDDARIRRMLIRGLRNEYEITEAESGEHAIALVDEAEPRFNLILLDQMMPQMDGLETLVAIKERDPYVPIIMLSAHSTLTLGIEFMRAGGSDFIEKPLVDIDIVRLRIQRALKTAEELRRAVAQRQQAEAALLENEARCRTLIEHAPDGVFVADTQGKLIDVNTSGCNMLGYTHEALLSMTMHDLVLDTDDRTVLLYATSAESPVTCQLRLKRHDGTPLSTEVSTKILPGGLWQSIVRDITERQQLEATLRQAKEAAEMDSYAKCELLTMISDEMRAPIHDVVHLAEWLMDSTLTSEQHEKATTIRQCGLTLQTYGEAILDSATIGTAEFDLKPLDFSLYTVVNEILDLLTDIGASKNLVLACLVHPEVPTWLTGDKSRLRQLLTLLGEIAVRFAETGEIVLQVTCDEASDQEALIRFELSQAGPYIPTKPQVRQLLCQVDDAISWTTEFALAIAKRLAAKMGGDLDVRNAPDEGSTLCCTVRLAMRQAPLHIDSANASSLHDVRVLCVDANTTRRSILERQLSLWGMQVSGIADSTKVLTVLQEAQQAETPYRVVIIDRHMPDINGLVLAQSIKSNAAGTASQVILLGSAEPQKERQNRLQDDIAIYLPTPVHPFHLFNCLTTMLDAMVSMSAVVPDTHALQAGTSDQTCTRILVAECDVARQTRAVRILEQIGYSVDVICNGREAIKAVAHTTYACLFIACDLPETDGYSVTQTIRADERQTADHLPIFAMLDDTTQYELERCLRAGMDDYANTPLQAKDLIAILAHWVPMPGGIPVGSEAKTSIVSAPRSTSWCKQSA